MAEGARVGQDEEAFVGCHGFASGRGEAGDPGPQGGRPGREVVAERQPAEKTVVGQVLDIGEPEVGPGPDAMADRRSAAGD